ncbi:hypothetical protein ACYOEI_12450, partial [Singulisphaera rosea]
MSLPETGSRLVLPRFDSSGREPAWRDLSHKASGPVGFLGCLRSAIVNIGLLAVIAVLWGLCSGVEAATDAASTDASRRTFFEEKIRPVLAGHCQSCHGPQKQEGGLRVDWREP